MRRISPGDLIELEWLDACFYPDVTDVSREAMLQGGETLTMVGFVTAVTAKSLLLCGELDDARTPHRDMNLIPRKLIVRAKIIKRSACVIEN